MKAVTVKQLKEELSQRPPKELLEICLRLSKFKKENKELLTYLLFESTSQGQYIETVKREIDEQFTQINTSSYYFIKKSLRKILRNVKKYIRYALNKQTEVELLIYYCQKLNEFKPSIFNNQMLRNLYKRQIEAIKKAMSYLHEDLQYDYNLELEELKR